MCRYPSGHAPLNTKQTIRFRCDWGLATYGACVEVCAETLAATREHGVFTSVDDLVLRVPQLNRKELTLLANVGALNGLNGVTHRRDALWQVERAGKPEGPLLMQQSQWLERRNRRSLRSEAMTPEERLVADYAVSSVTTGPHPMSFRTARTPTARDIFVRRILHQSPRR